MSRSGWLVMLTPTPAAQKKYENKTSSSVTWTTDPIRMLEEANWPHGYKSIRLGKKRIEDWRIELVIGPIPTNGTCGIIVNEWIKSRKLDRRIIHALQLGLAVSPDIEVFARDPQHVNKLRAQVKEYMIYKQQAKIKQALTDKTAGNSMVVQTSRSTSLS